MIAAIDTNVVIYALDSDAGERGARARRILAAAAESTALLPLQVAGETMNALTRRRGWATADARATVEQLLDSLRSIETTEVTVRNGLRIADQHRLSYWDALIVATAAAGGADVLLTEDLQDGRAFSPEDTGSRRLTIVDPFAPGNLAVLRTALPGAA
jgi:predicted nucleic acid-binding protein